MNVCACACTCVCVLVHECVRLCMCACLSVYRGRLWDGTVYRLVAGVGFIIDSSSGCSPMAGCKPNQCYNILILCGYVIPNTCNTTIPHTTPTHTTPNRASHTSWPFTASLMGIFVLGLCAGSWLAHRPTLFAPLFLKQKMCPLESVFCAIFCVFSQICQNLKNPEKIW